MNKKLVWIIIAVIVVIGIIAYAMNKNSSNENTGGGLEINEGDDAIEPQSGESGGLVTPDDDFSEIDDAMNYIE